MKTNNNTITETLFGINIQYYARGFVLHVTGKTYKQFNGMVFTAAESVFLEALLHNLITSYFKTHNKIEQHTEITCPYCGSLTMQPDGVAWKCKTCGYKIKHYGVLNNESK